MENIGNDSESKVNEQTVAASAAPASAAQSSPELGVVAVPPRDEAAINGTRRQRDEARQADQAELNRGLQVLVVEKVEDVLGDVGPAAHGQTTALAHQPLGQRVVVDTGGHRGSLVPAPKNA